MKKIIYMSCTSKKDKNTWLHADVLMGHVIAQYKNSSFITFQSNVHLKPFMPLSL